MKNSNRTIKHNLFNIPHPQLPKKNKPLKFHLTKEQRKSLEIRKKEKLCFSFYYLDIEHEAFNLGKTNVPWFKSLLKVLRDISKMTRNELVVINVRRFNCHEHDFNKTQYKYNFTNDFLEQTDCRQFDISNSNGRVHGFIFGNTFYIVWLDPHHNLNPDNKFGRLTLYSEPKDSYQNLFNKYKCLKKEKKELENSYEELINKMAKMENLIEENGISSDV